MKPKPKIFEWTQTTIIMANNKLFKMWGRVGNKIWSIKIIPKWGISMINKIIVSNK